MSNASIAKRLLEVLGRVRRGEADVSAFADGVEVHGPALESLPPETLDRLYRLSVEAICEDVSPLETELLGFTHSDRSLREAEALLQTICDV